MINLQRAFLNHNLYHLHRGKAEPRNACDTKQAYQFNLAIKISDKFKIPTKRIKRFLQKIEKEKFNFGKLATKHSHQHLKYFRVPSGYLADNTWVEACLAENKKKLIVVKNISIERLNPIPLSIRRQKIFLLKLRKLAQKNMYQNHLIERKTYSISGKFTNNNRYQTN